MIARVPMTPFERLRCYQQMPRWMYRNRTKLFGGALQTAKVLVDNARRRPIHEVAQ